MRISADDGNRAVLTTVDHAAGEAGHHWPHVLPDGRHVLYTLEVDGKPYSEARIVLLSLVTGQRRVLIDGGTDARYLPTGHVVYWREGAVWKVPFDTDRLELTGQASLALPNVMVSEANGHAHFAATADGTLVYLSGRDAQMERSVMLVDRTGQSRALTADRPILRVGIDLARWTPARSGDHRRERQPLDDGTGSNVIDANHV